MTLDYFLVFASGFTLGFASAAILIKSALNNDN